jgi:tetratricopeptide (TPR) repeat protein
MRMLKTILASFVLLFAAGSASGQNQPDIDNLLNQLKIAPDEQAAVVLERRIRDAWIKSGSPSAVIMLQRGLRELAAHDLDRALDAFDSALVLEPDYVEGYHRRAVARFEAGKYDLALEDIQEALTREPRHFMVLQSLSRIAEARNDWKGALAAFKRCLDVDPRMPHGADRLAMLQKKVTGEAL